jgi:hypothetical protein
MNIQMIVGHGPDSAGSEWGTVGGCCEHGNKISAIIKVPQIS